MLYYYKITESDGLDTTERQDVVRNNHILSSKQREICDFYCFKNRSFNYQPYICNECHFITVRSASLDDIKIVTVKGETYRVIAKNISNDRFIYLLKTNDLSEKKWIFAGFL